jgi:hypothetical protein
MMIVDALVLYALMVAAVELISWRRRRRQRREWERAHPLLRWEDWKHVAQ